MKALRWILGTAVVVGLAGCEFIELDPGGGGPGGGTVPFNTGFAFVRSSDRNVYVVDDQGDVNSPQRLTTQGGARHPAVSRNGLSIAFVRQVDGGPSELQTVPTSGAAQPSVVFSSTDPLCTGCISFHYPTFSPNGQFIVFTVYRTGSVSSLARVNADGSGFQFLTGTTVSFGAASFYPSGQAVLAPAGSSFPNQLTQLAQVSVSGGSPVYLSNNLGEARAVKTRAAVSPDGTQVAFDGELYGGGSRIFVAPLGQQLGALVQVTDYTGETGVLDTFPTWMGNTRLGFLSNSGGSDNIYSISASQVRGTGSFLVPGAAEPSYGGGL